MKYIFTIIILFVILFFNGCTKEKEKEIVLDSTDLEQQMIEAYNKGLKALEEGDVLYAAKNFNIVENIYPQSIWAPRSILMSAYSYYSQDYYGDAIFELKRFLKNYPSNDNYPYAYFLLATCYYETIKDEKKDLSSLLKSKKYFKIVIDEYPNTDFSLDAKFKLLMIDNILASKEIYIGNYYVQRKKWIPAINRYKNVIEKYGETEYVEEALHRLVEVNYALGLENEAKKYAILLGYNYQSSEWYEESYKIFNKNYKKKSLRDKKSLKKSTLEKLKSLIQ